MSVRHQPFLANSPGLEGIVTRFAILDVELDLQGGTALHRVVLDWVLVERTVEQGEAALSTPWQATFYWRVKGGATVVAAAVVVTGDDAVVDVSESGARFHRFHVEGRIVVPLDELPLALEATIRRVEDVARSPVGDMLGYVDAPDREIDPPALPPQAFPPADDVELLEGGFDDTFGDIGAGPLSPEPPTPVPVPRPVPVPAPAPAAAARDPQEPFREDAPIDAAVFCPPKVGRATRFLVQVFLYPPEQAEAVRLLAREVDDAAARRGVLSLLQDVPAGTRIDLRLEMPGLVVEEPDAALVWRGTPAPMNFDVAVPADAAPGTAIGRVRLFIAGVPAGTLRFQVAVGAAATSESARTAVTLQRYRRAFVSYSSKDRAEVLRRVQAFRIAGLSIFQDVLDLEPGDRWERELYRELDDCDVMLLFWSRAAAESPWVAREIDYALSLQRGDADRPPAIQPVPIEGPPIPPPPEKLRHLHFNDALLAHIATAQASKQ